MCGGGCGDAWHPAPPCSEGISAEAPDPPTYGSHLRGAPDPAPCSTAVRSATANRCCCYTSHRTCNNYTRIPSPRLALLPISLWFSCYYECGASSNHQPSGSDGLKQQLYEIQSGLPVISPLFLFVFSFFLWIFATPTNVATCVLGARPTSEATLPASVQLQHTHGRKLKICYTPLTALGVPLW